MKVCVLGLWHLGSVTAGCLAALGHRVVGLDWEPERVADLNGGVAPVSEPGLEELLAQGLGCGQLRFATPADQDLAAFDVLWVCCDTPLGEGGAAQPERVIARIEQTLPALRAGTLVVVSSQLPVGSTRRLQRQAERLRGAPDLSWACVPENLRLGSAVSDFLHPERIVAGLPSGSERQLLEQLLRPIAAPIEWMSVESAEMTKHALNAFLAVSVTFANELASICEAVGADATEVERGLKTDRRIGARAYLAPGAALAGGTLAREVAFLNGIAHERSIDTPLLAAVQPSNAAHRRWARNTLSRLFDDLSRTTVAVWGLTYKPGTDTLRDSPAVELCDWMLEQGAAIRVHDPAVRSLPAHWAGAVQRAESPLAAVRGADALVLATPWPIYREVGAGQLAHAADRLVVLDAGRFMPHLAAAGAHVSYLAVGLPGERA